MLTALEKLPADRFATAAEFAEALQDKSYRLDRVDPAAAAAPAGSEAPGRRGRLARSGRAGWRAALAARDRRGALGLAPPGARAAR